MIVFVRTQTDTLISAGGMPEGTAGVVTEADGIAAPEGRLDAADEAMEEEDGGMGLLKKQFFATYSQTFLGAFHVSRV